MKNLIKKYKIYLISGVIGGVLGFLYWRFIGCSSGTCPITSVWYTSSIYGLVFGLLTGSIILDEIKKRKKNEQIQRDNK